jgi:hypothetical protein
MIRKQDYDRFSSVPYGPDGCFDPNHDANAGLPDDVWCKDCLFRALHESKYSFVSRADFWIASGEWLELQQHLFYSRLL